MSFRYFVDSLYCPVKGRDLYFVVDSKFGDARVTRSYVNADTAVRKAQAYNRRGTHY